MDELFDFMPIILIVFMAMLLVVIVVLPSLSDKEKIEEAIQQPIEKEQSVEEITECPFIPKTLCE